jgi:hypothetical protein
MTELATLLIDCLFQMNEGKERVHQTQTIDFVFCVLPILMLLLL